VHRSTIWLLHFIPHSYAGKVIKRLCPILDWFFLLIQKPSSFLPPISSTRNQDVRRQIVAFVQRVLVNCPAPGRGTEFCFRSISFFLSFFLCLFLCQQHYEKTTGPICMKFSGKVWSDHRTTWFNFESIRVNGSAGRRSSFVITGHSSESVAFARWQQRTGVNKSVA